MERLQRVDRIDWLRFYVPLELLQHHLVRQEIDQRETMEFDRLHLFHEVEHLRRHCRRAAEARGWPSQRPRAARTRQAHGNRIGAEVLTSAAQHLAECD